MTISDSTPVSPEELAGRWARLGAALVDGVLVGVAGSVIMIPSGLMARAMQQDPTAMLWQSVIGMALYALINARLLASSGQTVGKRLLHVRIVDHQTHQVVPVWNSLALRYLLFAGVPALLLDPTLGIGVLLLDIVFIFGKDRRCVHDLVAGTIVVRA